MEHFPYLFTFIVTCPCAQIDFLFRPMFPPPPLNPPCFLPAFRSKGALFFSHFPTFLFFYIQYLLTLWYPTDIFIFYTPSGFFGRFLIPSGAGDHVSLCHCPFHFAIFFFSRCFMRGCSFVLLGKLSLASLPRWDVFPLIFVLSVCWVERVGFLGVLGLTHRLFNNGLTTPIFLFGTVSQLRPKTSRTPPLQNQ